MLGLGVAKAFNVPQPQLLEAYVLCDETSEGSDGVGEAELQPYVRNTASEEPGDWAMVLILPHTSGVSHFWNNPDDVHAAALHFRRFIQDFALTTGGPIAKH